MHVAEVVGVRFNKSGPLHFRHCERERSNLVDGIFLLQWIDCTLFRISTWIASRSLAMTK